jgi:hypothetical protein
MSQALSDAIADKLQDCISNPLERNDLINYYIRFYPESKLADLKVMAQTECLPSVSEDLKVVNKR